MSFLRMPWNLGLLSMAGARLLGTAFSKLAIKLASYVADLNMLFFSDLWIEYDEFYLVGRMN